MAICTTVQGERRERAAEQKVQVVQPTPDRDTRESR
jgi:hypothetical protein